MNNLFTDGDRNTTKSACVDKQNAPAFMYTYGDDGRPLPALRYHSKREFKYFLDFIKSAMFCTQCHTSLINNVTWGFAT